MSAFLGLFIAGIFPELCEQYFCADRASDVIGLNAKNAILILNLPN